MPPAAKRMSSQHLHLTGRSTIGSLDAVRSDTDSAAQKSREKKPASGGHEATKGKGESSEGATKGDQEVTMQISL